VLLLLVSCTSQLEFVGCPQIILSLNLISLSQSVVSQTLVENQRPNP
jgi:hypothetical protein